MAIPMDTAHLSISTDPGLREMRMERVKSDSRALDAHRQAASRPSKPLFDTLLCTTFELLGVLTRPRCPKEHRTKTKTYDSPAHDHSVFMSSCPVFRPLQRAHLPSSCFFPSFNHIQTSPLSSRPARLLIFQRRQIRCDR